MQLAKVRFLQCPLREREVHLSVVVTRVEKDAIIIGTDSALVFDDLVVIAPHGKKLSVGDDYLVAVVGSAQQASLFEQFCHYNRPTGNTSYDMTDFYHEYVTTLNDKNYNYDAEDVFHAHYVWENKAWFIEGYTGYEIEDYNAVGSGSQVALGALGAGADVEEALRLACIHISSCSLPLVVATYSLSDQSITVDHIS